MILSFLSLGSAGFFPLQSFAETLAQAPQRQPRSRSQSSQQPRSVRQQPKKQSPKKRSHSATVGGFVSARIVAEQAQVYSQPDFDANVIATLPQGRTLRVSRSSFGQYAKFHRVAVGSRMGYVADIDLSLPKGARTQKEESVKPQGTSAKSSENRAEKSKKSKKPSRPKQNLPLYFSRSIGVLVGSLSFKEEIASVDAKESVLIYGLKITGSDVLIDGPIVDFNLAFHYGAPSYYNALSQIQPSGFIVFTDAMFQLPLVQSHNAMGFFGIGPLLTYSNFRVLNANRLQSLSRLGIGLSFSAGAALRYESVVFRLEGKYYLDGVSHTGIQASVQTEF